MKPVRDLSAGELLAGVGEGKPDAWHEIIRRYRWLVVRAAGKAGLSDSDAADVAQVTWVQLWKHGHQIREPARLAAWLACTARREAIRLSVASRRYVLYADPSDEHSLASRLAVHDEYAVERASSDVQRALDRLPSRYRTLLRLISSDLDLSYSELADRMGVPIGSIGPMRMRAIRMLKKTPEFAIARLRRGRPVKGRGGRRGTSGPAARTPRKSPGGLAPPGAGPGICGRRRRL